jgi:multiple sugar transport system permease protein
MVEKGLVKNRNSRSSIGRDDKLALSLIIPSAIIIFGVMLFPMIYSLFMSLSKIDFENNTMKFVGLSNYLFLFQDANFISSILTTLYFAVITVFFEIVLGICMALVLNKDFKGCGFLRGVMILPWALPSVVNAVMWKWIFNANYGALNALLSQLHIISHYHVWLGQPFSALVCVIYANVWKETPYVVLLTLAALSNISGELYEAARVDGSSAWHSFWKLTLPLLKPILTVLLISKTIWALQTFDLPYILTGGGPSNSTELISLYIQKTALMFTQFGYGASMSYVLMLVTFVLCMMYIKLISKKGELG